MSKRSKLALILAMLLGASTVISACGGGNSNSSSSDSSSSSSSSSEISPSEEEEIANDMYKERIGKWMQYVEYNAPETVATLTKEELTSKDTNTVSTKFNNGTKIYKTEETGTYTAPFTYVVDDPTDADPAGPTIEVVQEEKTGESLKTKVYAKATGAVIGEFLQKTYLEVDDAVEPVKVKKDPAKTKADDVLFAFDEIHKNVLEVAKTTYTFVAPAAPDGVDDTFDMDAYLQEQRKFVKNYEAVVTYTYYDVTTGNVLAKDLEEKAVEREEDVLDIGDKTYVMVEEGIAKVFEKNMEYDLPLFDATKKQYMIGLGSNGKWTFGNNDEPYVYFEQGEYGYRIDEEPVNAVQISEEISLAQFPGVSVRVYKDYELVATYETDAYHVSGYGVLPNGNIYFCEYRILSKDATEYDFSDTVNKYNAVHTILDVQTGEAKELDNDFVVSKVFTEATDDIKTLLNVNTLAIQIDENRNEINMLQSLKIKEGYVLAEITEIADGALQGNSTFAVLDSETMELVEKLPKIVPTQFGYASFVNEDHMLIMMKMVDNQLVYYTANVETGNLELFSKSAVGQELVMLDYDCFLMNKKVYDFEWNEVADLTDYAKITPLGNGKLLLEKETWYSYSDYNNRDYTWHIAYVQRNSGYYYDEERYSLNIEYAWKSDSASDTMPRNVDVAFNGKLIVVREDDKVAEIYDANFNLLFSKSNTTKTVYEQNNYWKYVEYNVTTSVSYQVLEEGVYVVTTIEKWEKYNQSGYNYDEEPSEEVMANNDQEYYTNYIVK